MRALPLPLPLCICIMLVRTALAAEPQAQAKLIVKDSGWKRGVCVDLTSSPKLAIALAKASELSIYRVEKNAAAVAASRKLIEAAGLSPLRVRVEAGPLASLGYPDYCANLVLAATSSKEILRILRPAGGVAYFTAGAPSAGKGYKAGQGPGPGGLSRLERLPLSGAADWSHYQYDPTNNRYSPDTNIKDPFRVLWYRDPLRTRGFMWCGQSLAAGGRFFLTDVSYNNPKRTWLTAMDAYNGVTLWEREAGGDRYFWLPPPKVEARSNWVRSVTAPGKVHLGQMVLGDNKVFLVDSEKCMVIDAATGKDLAAFKAPPPTSPQNHWRYLAFSSGTLYGFTAGPDELVGRSGRKISGKGGPATFFALDSKTGKPRWVRGGKAGDPIGTCIDGPIAIGDGRVYMRAGNGLHALDAATGKTKWTAEGLDAKKGESWWEGVAHDGKLYLYRYAIRFYGRKTRKETLVFAAADGKRLEEEKAAGRPLYFSVKKKLCRKPAGARACVYGSAAGNVFFGRNGWERIREGSPRTSGGGGYGGFRAACLVGVLPAGGVVHSLPNWGCKCSHFSATITMQPGKAVEKFDGKLAPILERGGGFSGPAKAAGKDDWPAYRADAARSGVTGQNISGSLEKSWETKLSGKLTPPIVVGGTVFVASSDETVRALDASSGKTKWTFYASGPMSASPFYSKGRLYFGSQDGWVYCLGAADGKLLWRFRAAPFARRQMGFSRMVSAWPVHQGVVVAGGKLYGTAGRIPGNGIYVSALDATSGKHLWTSSQSRSSAAPSSSLVFGGGRLHVPFGEEAGRSRLALQLSPNDGRNLSKSHGGILAEICYVPGDGGKGFLLHGGGGLGRGYGEKATAYGCPYYLSPLDGKSFGGGRKMLPGGFGDSHSFLPVADGRRVYFRRGGKLVAVERSKLEEFRKLRNNRGGKRRPGVPVSGPRDKLLAWNAGELPCGKPAWVLVSKDTVLTGGPKGVTAVDAASGKPRWSVALPEATLSPAVAGGRVFLTSKSGKVYCLSNR